MKRYRRLRRLVPDEELLRRRAAGEGLRTLAADYGVAHTTLGRYFKRPEVARELREARRSLRAEQRAAAARQAAEGRLERDVRRRAKEQQTLARELARHAAAAPGWRRRRRDPYAAWLDEQDARRPLTRADLRSRSDDRAEEAVAAGGGIEAVLEATALRTRGNVLRLIDPTILVRAFANDAEAAAAAAPGADGLRRLVPDQELLRRRAAGEPLRRLAADYGVAHTTLCRYFQRPEVARQLRALRRRLPAAGRGERVSSGAARGGRQLPRTQAVELAAAMRASSCPVHGQAADVRLVEDASEYRIEASFCCERAQERALRALRREAEPN